MSSSSRAAQLAIIVLAFALLCLWDASGWDLTMARWAGTPQGFPWRRQPLLMLWLHEIPRYVSGALLVVILLSIRWPFGILRQIKPSERLQLALTMLAGITLAAGMKHFSRTSCPWSLQEFGGVAHYVSHWRWGVPDGGSGKCFPAGHASAAFAYIGGWFVFRKASPRLAARWLATFMIAGLVLGLFQQWRGAHYMSHTLWTCWLCWTSAWVIDALATALRGLPMSERKKPGA